MQSLTPCHSHDFLVSNHVQRSLLWFLGFFNLTILSWNWKKALCQEILSQSNRVDMPSLYCVYFILTRCMYLPIKYLWFLRESYEYFLVWASFKLQSCRFFRWMANSGSPGRLMGQLLSSILHLEFSRYVINLCSQPGENVPTPPDLEQNMEFCSDPMS